MYLHVYKVVDCGTERTNELLPQMQPVDHPVCMSKPAAE